MRTVSMLACLALAFALAACAGATGELTEGTPTTAPIEATPSGDPPSLPVGDVPAELLQAIVAEAADDAGVEPDEVQVLTADAVTWSDGSLGCPEPGMAYTQALVPGYRVVLEIGGEELNFHAAESGSFRFCADPQPPIEGHVDR